MTHKKVKIENKSLVNHVSLNYWRMTKFLSYLFLCFWDKVLLRSLDCPGTHFVDCAGLDLMEFAWLWQLFVNPSVLILFIWCLWEEITFKILNVNFLPWRNRYLMWSKMHFLWTLCSHGGIPKELVFHQSVSNWLHQRIIVLANENLRKEGIDRFKSFPMWNVFFLWLESG